MKINSFLIMDIAKALMSGLVIFIIINYLPPLLQSLWGSLTKDFLKSNSNDQHFRFFRKVKHVYTKFWEKEKIEEVKKQFAFAGLGHYFNYEYYLLLKCFLALIMAIGCVIHWYFSENSDLLSLLFRTGLLSGCGFYAVDYLLKFQIKRRSDIFDFYIVDILDIIIIGIDAGLSYHESIEIVVDEFKSVNHLIYTEFTITNEDIELMSSPREPILRLLDRIDSQYLEKIAQVLLPGAEIGAPLSQSLNNLAALIWREKLSVVEQQARKIPNILTISTVIFLLPIMGIILFGPIYYRMVN